MRLRPFSGYIVALAAHIMFAGMLLAQEQQGGGQQQPPGGTPSPGPGQGQGQTTPGREQPFPGREQPFPGQQQQQQQRMPEMQRPIFLQGKVMLDDGTPAPPSVVIERVCNGRPIPEAYTDSKGRFSFQVGQNTNFIADASFGGMEQMGNRPGGASGPYGGMGDPMGGGAPGGISERELIGCELRASLAGYRSTTVELSGRRMFDNPDVGTLILRRLANVEGLTISATTLNAPKDAKKSYEKGIKEASKQKWDKASVELEKAVTLYPQYAVAWQTLGQVYEAQKQDEKAREAYGKALAADAKFVNPYIKLALMDAKQQNWRGVADTTDRIIKMNPYDFPDAFFYNAVANLNLQNSAAAEKSAREALKLNAHQRFPQVEHVLGLALAQQNNFDEAKLHLKKYLELVPQAQNADVVKQQLSQIEAHTAKNQPGQQ